MKVRLELIRIDGGTQNRAVESEVVDKYCSLMRDGIELPPIDVIFDGKTYYLVDGHHRYYCFLKLKRESIEAKITKGTRDDAIWLSFAANKAHGFPRQAGVVKQIIEKILTDERWSKKPETEIAKHVGTTKQYVSQVKKTLLAHGSSSLPIARSGEIEVKRGDKVYTQKSQEKQYEKRAVIKDENGKVIPDDLVEVYIGRQVIKDLVNQVDEMKNQVKHKLEDKDQTFGLLHWQTFQVACENLRGALKDAIPYAVCPYCSGEVFARKTCKACKGTGFANRVNYDVSPRELKGQANYLKN